MYGWIWRKLPFGLPGKIAGSVLMIVAVAALLWFVVFPWADPYLPPYDDVQVTQDSGVPGGPAGDGPGTDAPGLDDHDLPYDTERNNPPPPTPSPSR